ncbi:Hypothetical protein A7982_00894 [Minicystis rosea]|nr:Hypothetical protein A7982_00894 [Minicystis rosea]
MKHRLAALAFASAVVTAAPLALADALPPDASATGGSGGTGGTAPSTGGNAATGGGSGSGESSSGCTAAPGNTRGSAAIVIGLGLLCAIPLARRRSSTK